MKPDDKQCLVTRSKCYLQLGNAEASLADAEKALEKEKDKDAPQEVPVKVIEILWNLEYFGFFPVNPGIKTNFNS